VEDGFVVWVDGCVAGWVDGGADATGVDDAGGADVSGTEDAGGVDVAGTEDEGGSDVSGDDEDGVEECEGVELKFATGFESGLS
jgi:hypothetical protein